ncbi:MAG: hypothetical protein ACOVOA_00800, partial [Allorhizobium sp.]
MASISLKNSLKAGNSVQEHRSLRTAPRTKQASLKSSFGLTAQPVSRNLAPMPFRRQRGAQGFQQR